MSLSSRWTMPGRILSPSVRQLRAEGEEGVDERAAGVAGRRVDGEAGRLVHDDDVFVLVDDREGDALRGQAPASSAGGSVAVTRAPPGRR